MLKLRDDDAGAVEMVIQYLYFLDYPSTAQDTAQTNGQSNSLHTDSDTPKVNGNEIHHRESSVLDTTESRTDDPPESVDLEEFLPSAPKKNKKKKRKKSVVVRPEAGDTVTEEASPLNGDDSVPVKWDEIVAAEEAMARVSLTPKSDPSAGHLAIHARVYQLSKKYGIEALKALSLEKFGHEAGNDWDTADFLEAAKVVYAPLADDSDRNMKEIVTQVVCQHRELLDKPETGKVIRGLELGYDVLMRVHKQGGFV